MKLLAAKLVSSWHTWLEYVTSMRKKAFSPHYRPTPGAALHADTQTSPRWHSMKPPGTDPSGVRKSAACVPQAGPCVLDLVFSTYRLQPMCSLEPEDSPPLFFFFSMNHKWDAREVGGKKRKGAFVMTLPLTVRRSNCKSIWVLGAEGKHKSSYERKKN